MQDASQAGQGSGLPSGYQICGSEYRGRRAESRIGGLLQADWAIREKPKPPLSLQISSHYIVTCPPHCNIWKRLLCCRHLHALISALSAPGPFSATLTYVCTKLAIQKTLFHTTACGMASERRGMERTSRLLLLIEGHVVGWAPVTYICLSGAVMFSRDVPLS